MITFVTGLVGKVVRNKYVLTLVLFLLWLIFFDANNLIDRARQITNFRQLQKDKEYYIERIANDTQRMNELKTNRENLEKFAREQYLMKQDDEEIFIIPEN